MFPPWKGMDLGDFTGIVNRSWERPPADGLRAERGALPSLGEQPGCHVDLIRALCVCVCDLTCNQSP